jgi:hypothetical protein
MGGGDDGVAVCKKIANDSGALSDHADGRAWDWHAEATNPDDVARVNRLLDWLLRTDERGNRNAMARRIGITYIIWNHRYYRVGSDNAHWTPYTGTADPHDTHVHFSFSMAGAMRETSFWVPKPLSWWLSDDSHLTFGASPQVPLAGDWDGGGRDTPAVYDPTNRTFTMLGGATTPAIGPMGAIPLVGDWNGDKRDEVGVYDPMTRQFEFYTLSGEQARPPQQLGRPGDLPIVGDWDGDGVDDVGVYRPSERAFFLSTRGGGATRTTVDAPGETPRVGDWDGDGRSDVAMFDSATNWLHFRNGQAVRIGTFRDVPVVGDWDGDGRDDYGTVSGE